MAIINQLIAARLTQLVRVLALEAKNIGSSPVMRIFKAILV